MFSKQEASLLRKEFWTIFGQYMKPIPSAKGEKINWLNYKTGEKHISFKMNADNRLATIAIEITHPDADLQQLYFEQFSQMKNILLFSLKEEWNEVLHTEDENGRLVSKIYKIMPGVNIFNKADWPQLISFFKPRIIALDEFWSSARYGFEALR